MKKILYIGNNIETSNPTTLVQLSKILNTTGFEVLIYSNKKNKVLRLIHMCIGVFQHRKVDFILIDTYSTLNFYYAFLIAQLARLLSIKYIPILHGGNLPARLKRNSFLSKLIFKYSFKNVSPSKYLSVEFEKCGYSTCFIPNALNLKRYLFKRRTKIQPRLLWVRAFDKIYNPLMAVEVLSLLKVKYPLAQLCMIGPDKDGSLKEIKKIAKEKGVFDSIDFTGKLSKKEWIEKSKEFDIFINTTTIDNIPVSVLEAMALGLPVISTNVGGIPYLIEDGLTGVLVDNKDSLEMTNSIIDLLNDSEKVIRITNNARNMVCKFDVELVKQQWHKILS